MTAVAVAGRRRRPMGHSNSSNKNPTAPAKGH